MSYRGARHPGPGSRGPSKYKDLFDAVEAMKPLDPPLPWKFRPEDNRKTIASRLTTLADLLEFNIRTYTFGDVLYIVRFPGKKNTNEA